MKAQETQRDGFTLVEIMIVVAVIGLLAVMAVPSYVRARDNSQVSVCLNNLRQIDSAKDLFAIEAQRTTGEAVDEGDLTPYLKQPFDQLLEPAGGNYTVQAIGVMPTCSIGGLHVLPPED